MAANVFTGDALTRAKADLERDRAGAAADSKELPGAAKALANAKTGNDMVAIGKLYFSSGDYANAADAIQKGLAKGGVTDTDDANALLGVALVRSRQAGDGTGAVRCGQGPQVRCSDPALGAVPGFVAATAAPTR